MKECGVLVPLVTPCTPKGEIDVEGLESVCSYMLAAGCNAIFVGGSTGRGPWFSRTDGATVCSTVAKVVGPQVPLFAGCMASGLAEMLENARLNADAGAQVAVVTAPGYFNYSQQEVESIFLKFADVSPLPVMIYDIPAFAGMKLDAQMVGRLVRHGRVMGFKDSSADLGRFQQLLGAVADLPDFCLLQGKENLLAESLWAGASGFVVSLVHIDPRPFAALYRATREGRVEQARALQTKIEDLLDLVKASVSRRPETSTFFHFLDECLRARGVCPNIVLEHEGSCPAWLAENARMAMEIADAAGKLVDVAPS